MNLPLVLDVVISLIFIYLVLSLLASELQELIATLLQWRARHLRDSIANLLTGNQASQQTDRVMSLVDDLYNDPLIKDLNQEARGFLAQALRGLTRWVPGNRRGDYGNNQATGPSYIPAETFASALVDRLGVSGLVDQLVDHRLETLIQRIIGNVSRADDAVQLSNADTYPGLWEIANRSGVDISSDRHFYQLVLDYEGALNDYRQHYADLNATTTRLSESLDRFINSEADSPSRQYFLQQVAEFKRNLFGQNNDRIMFSAGLQPTMQEVTGLMSKGSRSYRELATRFDNVQNQADVIIEHVKTEAQQRLQAAQSADPQAILDLQTFKDQVLNELSDEEYRIYRDYQSYRKATQIIDRLPDSIQDSMSVLAQRAQTRARQTGNALTELQTEVAGWFDNSMGRASGVYKRNAKGVALLVGFAIAAFTNADTFHILNRVASDESLRQVVTDRAGQLQASIGADANNLRRPGQIAQELESLKNQTDQVLSDMPLPVTWNPSNLSRQLGCPYDPSPNVNSDLPYALLTQEQWNYLYRACLNQPDARTDAPVWMQVMQMINVKPFAFLRMLSGWLLSGIAIAMGAPFWFDLLGRLVNVRNTGAKPRSGNDVA
jgi:hypothetical protein